MKHGTYVTYVQRKCRCDECRAANCAYVKRRAREQAHERFNPDLSRLVDAEPARQHMRSLMSQGMGWKRIAKVAGVATGTTYVILYGKGGNDPAEHRPPRKRIRRDIAEKLLAVRLDLADGALTDAVGTTRRLRALVAIGWSQSSLGARLGIIPSNTTPLFDGSRRSVQVSTARAVAALYEELWDQPGPSTRARNDAGRKGWTPPLAWDDDTIDDPTATADLGEPDQVSNLGRHRQALVEDYLDTMWEHRGDVRAAAVRLGVSLGSLEQALRRARRDGVDVVFGRVAS